jgi:sulfite oxidase
MERREFLAASAALATAPAILSQTPSEPALAGKDARLKTITIDPMVLETPDELLATARVTPASALFVRNHHGGKPFLSVEPRPQEGDLEIVELDGRRKSVGIKDLAEIRKTEIEMVLQCTGNFRSIFSKLSPIKGSQWSKGGVGNVVFGGVPIVAIFYVLKIDVDHKGKFLTAEGDDQPEKAGQNDFEKSIPLEVALSRGLLATELNGKPIPAVHGGPLRLVIPGYYGSMQVKWLTQLRIEESESKSFYQASDYRIPNRLLKIGEQQSNNPSNSSPAAEMKINSRIFTPADGATVKSDSLITAKGVAWNDGSAAITSVELSIDNGATWKAATLAPSAGPYAFREWSLPITIAAGRHELWVRAVDALGRTQPLDGGLFWNPGGYAWNGVEKINVTAG